MKKEPTIPGASEPLKNGFYQEFFNNGNLNCAGEYSGGEKTGEWKYYLLYGSLRTWE